MDSTRTSYRESLRLAANPVLLLIEVGWRWAFGLGACALLFAAWLRVFGSTPVSDAELTVLGSRDPTLIAAGLLHIFQETEPDLIAASLIAIPAGIVLWIALATFGRLATLELLLPGSPRNAAAFFGVLSANIFRALWTSGVFVGMVFTLIASSLISLRFSPDRQQPNLAVYFLLIVLLLPLEAALWAVVNWFLSFTPIFSVREGCGPFGAVKWSIAAMRRMRKQVFRVSRGYGSLRLGALLALLALCGTVGAVADAAGGARGVVAIVIVLSLAYFVVADWLYLARMVAYIDLLREDAEALLHGEIRPSAPAPAKGPSSASGEF